MSEYIPFEIQMEILKLLPVKPLIQFRSVSKTWKSLIDSPEFAAAYGVRQTHPNHLILRYKHIVDVDIPGEERYFDIPGEERYLTFVDNDDHTFIKQDFAPTVPDLIKCLDSHSSVVGSSHGLLCLYGYYEHPDAFLSIHHGKEMAVLWNPSIRKSIGIEVPSSYDSYDAIFYQVRFHVVVGFGVCPVNNDPTILKISYVDTYKKSKKCVDISIPRKVRVFTLSSGTWKILSTNLPRETVRFRRNSQVVIDRFIYWAVCDIIVAEDGRCKRTFMLLSFDLTTKEFKEIYLPDRLALDNQNLLISKLRESLVLLDYTTEVEWQTPVCSLWIMMMDHGVTTSFTRLYTINMPHASIHKVLGFRNTGEPIMEKHKGHKTSTLEVYEPCSQQVNNLGIDGEDWSFFMCSYMETLLLLDQADGYIYSNNS